MLIQVKVAGLIAFSVLYESKDSVTHQCYEKEKVHILSMIIYAKTKCDENLFKHMSPVNTENISLRIILVWI